MKYSFLVPDLTVHFSYNYPFRSVEVYGALIKWNQDNIFFLIHSKGIDIDFSETYMTKVLAPTTSHHVSWWVYSTRMYDIK